MIMLVYSTLSHGVRVSIVMVKLPLQQLVAYTSLFFYFLRPNRAEGEWKEGKFILPRSMLLREPVSLSMHLLFTFVLRPCL